MEESVSGFEVTGSWGDIVEHGERITEALEDAGVDEETFEAWETWRPKAGERFDEEMNRKTSEEASVDAGDGERAGISAEEDLQTAGERLNESYERLYDEERGTRESVQESIAHTRRAADTAGRRALRAVEDAVYRDVMTRIAPYYFDSELVSANLSRNGRFGDGEAFALEVNVNDDDVKEEVRAILKEYEDEVDRWHIETDPTTANSVAAEGVEPRPSAGPRLTRTYC